MASEKRAKSRVGWYIDLLGSFWIGNSGFEDYLGMQKRRSVDQGGDTEALHDESSTVDPTKQMFDLHLQDDLRRTLKWLDISLK